MYISYIYKIQNITTSIPNIWDDPGGGQPRDALPSGRELVLAWILRETAHPRDAVEELGLCRWKVMNVRCKICGTLW